VRGVVVAALKARYAGPVWELTTMRGQRLTVTPNHPIATARGWIAASQLREGDDLLYERIVGMAEREHEQDRPAEVDQIFDTAAAYCARYVPAAVDLHGDAVGVQGEIDVVWSDRPLWYHGEACETQQAFDAAFVASDVALRGGVGAGSGLARRERVARAASGDPRGPKLGDDALARASGPLQQLGIVPSAHDDALLREQLRQRVAVDPEAPRQLQERCPGLIGLDRLRTLRRREWAGFVYDVQSPVGWIVANGLVVSNCRCRVITVFSDDAIASIGA
jgi:hypothetical protein